MSLLRDEDLITRITAVAPSIPYVEGIELPKDPYSKDSSIQGASVDLHIGNIYLPGVKEEDTGGTKSPKSDHVLMTGETAVVTTKETLHLPDNVAGFGFPPSRVSFRGLLMTNPGHVDPGYEGVMRFTVINMAREAYSLRSGDRIATLLLFQLEKAAHSGWRKRNPGGDEKGPSPISQVNINRLSKDFVDVDKRAKEIAKLYGIAWSVGITAAVGLIVAVLQLFSSGRLFSRQDIEDLKRRQESVEYDVKNRVNVEQKLQDFDNRLKDLERAKSNLTSRQNQLENPGKSLAPSAPGKRP
jgi:dCTP deaminase